MFIPFQTLLPELSKSYQSISKTKQLHSIIAKTHLSLDPYFLTKIIRFYAINADLHSARNLFDKSPNRSVYLWNSIIRAHARLQDFNNTFRLFKQMIASETNPDNFTLACILRACSENNDINSLRLVHGGVLAYGLGRDRICSSALISAYSKLGLVNEANKVFYGVIDPDLAMCNSLICGYGYCGNYIEGMKLFSWMRKLGEKPDGYTMVGLLVGLSDPGLLRVGEGVHGFCIKNSFDLNSHVSSSLVSMYIRCNSLDSAHKLFISLLNPDLVTWSALITGFAQSGDSRNALLFFREMNMEMLKTDSVLIAGALSASSQLALVRPGSELHGHILRRGLETDVMVSCALVDMYCKCGFLELATRVFEMLPNRNTVIYNSLILGLGSHGHGSEAFVVFDELLDKGLRPDEATFSALLHACGHAGLVTEGKELFGRMKDEFGIDPRTEHYVHMIKLLGSVGELEEAYNLVLTLSGPVDAGIWGALLSCCESHGDVKLAETILQHHMIEHLPEETCGYKVMLSNVYANEGRWDDVNKLRDCVTDGAERKMAGLSWVATGC